MFQGGGGVKNVDYFQPNLKPSLRAVYDGHWTWLSYKVVDENLTHLIPIHPADMVSTQG